MSRSTICARPPSRQSQRRRGEREREGRGSQWSAHSQCRGTVQVTDPTRAHGYRTERCDCPCHR